MMSSFIDDIKNAFRKKDNSLNQIIFLNVIVFLVVLTANVILTLAQHKAVYEEIINWLALPADFGTFITRPWTLFTYFFLHQDPFHILFNLLTLYWFGQIIGDLIGSKRITALYVYGGLMGGLFFLLSYNTIPYLQVRSSLSVLLGASAGTNAIVMAGATLVPEYTMSLLLFGPVRLKYIALACIAISMVQITTVNVGGGIAHFGGILVGYLFIVQLRKGNDIGKPINSIGSFFKNMFKKDNHMKVSYKNLGKSKSKNTGLPSQEEIDTILDKISQSGYESLSKEEKQKLFHASQN